jgi:hypothetical protein
MRLFLGKLLRGKLAKLEFARLETKKKSSEQAERESLSRPPSSSSLLDLLYQTVKNPQFTNGEMYTPIYTDDGLISDPRVIHNHDFMRNPKYINAYKVAEKALGYDHKMFWRLHVALWCASQAQKLPGDFVECGVWRGFLATAIMNYIPWPIDNRQFYLFDTWEGLDERYLTEKERNNQAKLDHFKPYYSNQYEAVKKHFSNYRNVQLVKGSVPETLDLVKIEAVSYLSLDMNCASPELSAAEHFWEKLVPGGMILLDDYGFVSYEEQKRGFDRFADRKGIEVLALPTGQGLIIKL